MLKKLIRATIFLQFDAYFLTKPYLIPFQLDSTFEF
jgi:hypothetical protein